MSTDNEISVVIVGHVDHGKSTFIGRLLFDTDNLPPDRLAEIKKVSAEQGRKMEFAYAMDQFQEERDANITIDTSQTFLKLNGRPYLLIDAPGHKEYLKNMMTGATQAKHAILMLDVNEGIREQTEKHARILKLLRISRLAVMVNKMDTVDCKETVFRAHETRVRELLGSHNLRADAVVPISAYHGENVARRSDKMGWYTGPIALDFLLGCQAPIDDGSTGPFCFPVQSVYETNGKKLLLGRVERGKISEGTNAILFPSGKSLTIMRVLKHKEKVSVASKGECVALDTEGASSIARGNVICETREAATPLKKFSAHVFWAKKEPLEVGGKVTLECRTQSTVCAVTKIFDELETSPSEELKGGDIARVEFAVNGDLLVEPPDKNEALSRVAIHHEGTVAGCGVVCDVER